MSKSLLNPGDLFHYGHKGRKHVVFIIAVDLIANEYYSIEITNQNDNSSWSNISWEYVRWYNSVCKNGII